MAAPLFCRDARPGRGNPNRLTWTRVPLSVVIVNEPYLRGSVGRTTSVCRRVATDRLAGGQSSHGVRSHGRAIWLPMVDGITLDVVRTLVTRTGIRRTAGPAVWIQTLQGIAHAPDPAVRDGATHCLFSPAPKHSRLAHTGPAYGRHPAFRVGWALPLKKVELPQPRRRSLPAYASRANALRPSRSRR
jgi:hypothetical protein